MNVLVIFSKFILFLYLQSTEGTNIAFVGFVQYSVHLCVCTRTHTCSYPFDDSASRSTK